METLTQKEVQTATGGRVNRQAQKVSRNTKKKQRVRNLCVRVKIDSASVPPFLVGSVTGLPPHHRVGGGFYLSIPACVIGGCEPSCFGDPRNAE